MLACCAVTTFCKKKKMDEETEMKCLWLKDESQTTCCYVQIAKEVTDFSSQYGSERSISYTASNLAGPEHIYPGYGDYTQACVFRTYGPWWKMAPSAVKKFKKTPDSFCSVDFIEVMFEDKVYPTRIELYETYNPGCVVKVLACDTSGTDVDTGKVEWVTLWSGPPQYPEAKPTIFSPPLKKVKFRTNIIRLELCHDLVEYYTELDSITLHGTNPSKSTKGSFQTYVRKYKDKQGNEESASAEKPDTEEIRKTEEIILALQDFTITDPDSNLPNVEEEHIEYTDNGHFNCLPGEIIQLILEYLDIPDLCHLAQTCRLLQKHSHDHLLFTELNLQPHWPKVGDSALKSLQTSCVNIQRLNLAWCGKGGNLTNSGLKSFLSVCSRNLTYIGLSCCQFVDATTLQILSEHCLNLEEIDLSGCRKVENLMLLRISKLRRLNLYRTQIDMHSLIEVIRFCPDLEHLNLGSCVRVASFDDVLIEIGLNNKKLVSLDLWQARTLTDIGLRAVAKSCPLLQELDVGWCPGLKSATGCFTTLIQKCRRLKKLYMTANRSVCDADINAIAQYCPDMEQIDILGTREVSPDSIIRVLEKCKNLKFFDVSFCGNILDTHVCDWEKLYPYINFKKSFQS